MTKQEMDAVSSASEKIRQINLAQWIEAIRVKVEAWKGKLNA